MKKYIPIISIFLCLSFFSCNGNNTRSTQETDNETLNENTEATTEATTTATTEESETEQSPNTWDYTQDVDDLSGQVTSVRATLISENEIEYEPGQTVGLAISINYSRITGSLRNLVTIVLGGDKYGSCKFSDYQGSGFLAVFDDGPIDDTWSLVTMTDNRRGLSFHLSDEVDSFLSKLKQSRTCKIQVNLEHVGKKTFIFHCEGFEWDYK